MSATFFIQRLQTYFLLHAFYVFNVFFNFHLNVYYIYGLNVRYDVWKRRCFVSHLYLTTTEILLHACLQVAMQIHWLIDWLIDWLISDYHQYVLKQGSYPTQRTQRTQRKERNELTSLLGRPITAASDDGICRWHAAKLWQTRDKIIWNYWT